jgi:hypothetical protein
MKFSRKLMGRTLSSEITEATATGLLGARVARWLVFKPKIIPIWVNIGGPLNGKFWYIL